MLRWLLPCLVAARALADPSPRPSAYESRVTGVNQERRDSAEAVTVYRVAEAREQSADLGTVLNRVQGISIARTGGLGSEARFSLNGISNDQVRFFLNGVPLEVAGFAFGLSSIPVNLVDGVEVYRGVVPLRFGADALGGAVNLLSPQSQSSTGGGVSIQGGSFSTLRFSAHAHHRSRHGLYQAAGAYLDSTQNDYPVSVQIPDANGRLHDAVVPLFHNAYTARGGFADVGVVDQPWVDKLAVRVFYSDYDKQLQNNPVMTVPYGAAGYGESVAGGSLVAAHRLGPIAIDLVASYSHRNTHFKDISTDVYDWLGNIIHQRPLVEDRSGPADDRYTVAVSARRRRSEIVCRRRSHLGRRSQCRRHRRHAPRHDGGRRARRRRGVARTAERNRRAALIRRTL